MYLNIDLDIVDEDFLIFLIGIPLAGKALDACSGRDDTHFPDRWL